MLDKEQFSWRASGGDASRRGLFPRPSRIHVRPRLHLSAHGSIKTSVVFDCETRAIVADMAGYVQAFSASGNLIWKTQLSGAISAAPVTHPSKSIAYVGTSGGIVYAMDTFKGSIYWQKEISTQSDPRILSDLLYLPSKNLVVLSSWGGRFHALNAESGSEQYSWDAGISPYSAVAADNDDNMYCLRASANKSIEFVGISSEGKETLLHSTPEDRRGIRRALVAASPVFDGERKVVYYIVNQEEGSSIHGWSVKDKARIWSCSLSSPVQATPTILHNGALAVADMAGSVHIIDDHGNLQSRYISGSDFFLAGGVADGSGSFYIGDPEGFLHLISPKGQGKVIFEAKRSIEARPSFDAKGYLYVPSGDRNVYVFTS